MAQLKDLMVTGVSRFINKVFTDTIQIKTLNAPMAANSTTYSAGTGGQILKTNGSSVYWGDSDSQLQMTQRGTTKAYLLATQTSPTANAQSVTALAENGVYLDTEVGTLVANFFAGTATRVSHALKIGSITYDGSSSATVEIYNGVISNPDELPSAAGQTF